MNSPRAPAFFHQGPSPLARLIFFASISLALLIVDVRFQWLLLARQSVATVMYPLQRLAAMPKELWDSASTNLTSFNSLQRENERLKLALQQHNEHVLQAANKGRENIQLRQLLGLQQQSSFATKAVEIIYEVPNPGTRKVVLDKGSQHLLAEGMPVLDDLGLVGQITRIYPLTSEVTLLVDREQTIPVQVLRNGLRGVAYGGQQPNTMEIHYMASNADVQVGDELISSGIDQVYPSGLPVAVVTKVEREAQGAFARVICKPKSGLDKNKTFFVVVQSDKPTGLTTEQKQALTKPLNPVRKDVNKDLNRDINKDANRKDKP
jgi:rod shape-determining protein MreC